LQKVRHQLTPKREDSSLTVVRKAYCIGCQVCHL